MQSRIHHVNGITIDYSRSSLEVFGTNGLKDSSHLYFKFSKNLIRTLAIQNHAELLLDFDLCLIDRANTNETIIQLFAIFVITKNNEPVNQFAYIQDAVAFARSLVIDEVRESGLQDEAGNDIIVPEFEITAESIHFVLGG